MSNEFTLDKETIELLPISTKELLGVINEKSLLALINNYGGTPIYIPNKAKPDHAIALLIGFDEFLKLSRSYASEIITVPRCLAIANIARNRRIFADKLAGVSVCDIATKNNLTTRAIQLILKKQEAKQCTL
jgi:hypothetical protein